MKKTYFLPETKICLNCKKVFERPKEYYGKKWVMTVYCSKKCFGKVLSKIQYEKFKDETIHPRWKGDSVGYYGVHDWITKHYGQPKKCQVCDLDDINRKYHWANLSYKYLRDIKDWKRMCVSCHRKYDYAQARANNELETSR